MIDDLEIKRLEDAIVRADAQRQARDDARDAMRQYMTMDIESTSKLERAMGTSIGDTIASSIGTVTASSLNNLFGHGGAVGATSATQTTLPLLPLGELLYKQKPIPENWAGPLITAVRRVYTSGNRWHLTFLSEWGNTELSAYYCADAFSGTQVEAAGEVMKDLLNLRRQR